MISEIKKTIKVLKRGGLILYPTDTVWGIGCDATNTDAVKNIYKIKNRPSEKALICLVEDIKMLKKYISNIPKEINHLINNPTPTTIIYNDPKNIAKNLVGSDNTIAIRIPRHLFSQRLIAEYGKPIVSTSANINKNETPKVFSEISSSILEGVDHVVNLQKETTTSVPSKIYKIEDNGVLVIIRE